MAKMTGTRREALSVMAVLPDDGTAIKVTLSHAKLMSVAKRGRGAVLEAAQLVPYTLQRPEAIFRGLRQDTDEPRGSGTGWLCYCSKPVCAYHRDGTKIAAYDNEVFLVFINADKVVYQWYWHPSDPDDPNLPADHHNRFKERAL
jgi:hypothetical protein